MQIEGNIVIYNEIDQDEASSLQWRDAHTAIEYEIRKVECDLQLGAHLGILLASRQQSTASPSDCPGNTGLAHDLLQ